MTSFSPIAKKLAGKFVREDWLDFVFSHVDPMLAVNRVLAEVVSISQETPDIKRFVFRPNANWQGFVAGQFMPVRVQIDGIYHERCYSLVSEPTDGLLEIGVKRQPNGKVSNWLHDHLAVGDVIELGEASGDFVLPQAMCAKLLLIAGGSGVTPVYSLLVEALKRRPALDVSVVYYANTENDLAFAKEMVELAVKHPGLKLSYALFSSGEGGKFSEQQLSNVCADYAERSAFICGPQGLMKAAADLWAAKGISAQLKQELFGPVGLASDAVGNAMPITLRRSQQAMLHTKTTLLESAEAGGARPAYGCRMGVCKQCSCTKVSGVVRDKVTGAIDSSPNTQVRICVSEPLSAVVLDI